MDTTDLGNIVLFRPAEFMKYYGLKKCFFLHLSYVGKNKFIHNIFSPEGVEMVYDKDSVAGFDIVVILLLMLFLIMHHIVVMMGS